MKKTIGEKIKEIRMQNNLTMDELAEELGYSSRSTINKIEKGINDISYEKLLLLLKKYIPMQLHYGIFHQASLQVKMVKSI